MREISIQKVEYGTNVTIVQPVNLYGCRLGNNVFIGPFTEIQNDVVIGNNTKIQSHSFICSKVLIGEDCFIGHGVMFINDDFRKGAPANGKRELWKSTEIGNYVSVGSNSTLLPVKVCDRVVIGAGSVVTKNISIAGVYAGNPAVLIRPL